MKVASVVIDWVTKECVVTDTDEQKHAVPLDQRLHVSMIGYPEPEEQDLVARELAGYMTKGYIITDIEIEPSFKEVKQAIQPLLQRLPKNYPAALIDRDVLGYSLKIGHTLIFKETTGRDAIKHTTNYVEAREKSPTLPIGVIYGIYD